MTYSTLTQTFAGQAAVGTTCWCSIQFAIPESLYSYYKRENDRQRGSFALHCPMGHQMIPAGPDPDKVRLKEELESAKRTVEYHRGETERQRTMRLRTERQLYAQKGVTTKLKKRVGHGVCPVPGCKRHFNNLERHIKGQHPDWRDQE